MPTIDVHREFKFSPDGREVVLYKPGQHEVTELCATYAQRKNYASPAGVPEVVVVELLPEAPAASKEEAVAPLAVTAGKKSAAKPNSKAKAQPKPKAKF